jgi:hypothetical protein
MVSPLVPDPEDRLRGEAGVGDLAEASEDQPDADRPENEPFANEQGQVGAAVRKRRFGDDRDGRKHAHQQHDDREIHDNSSAAPAVHYRRLARRGQRCPIFENWIRGDEVQFLAAAA